MTKTLKFIGTTIILRDKPLDVVTTNLLCSATGRPLNYVCCDSLASQFGLTKEALEIENLPPDFKEFVFLKQPPEGLENSIVVWDTLASALYLTMKRYPETPVRSLPESEILILSAWIDLLIDSVFLRPYDPVLFMIRTQIRRFTK